MTRARKPDPVAATPAPGAAILDGANDVCDGLKRLYAVTDGLELAELRGELNGPAVGGLKMLVQVLRDEAEQFRQLVEASLGRESDDAAGGVR